MSAESASFLMLEEPTAFAHSTSLQVFESGPLANPAGGVDVDSIRRAIASRLHAVPRYRQKLGWIPLARQPVWIDDPQFNLDYHVRHTSLPRPGDGDQLRRMVARIHAQRLDRSRPLWECWVLEGLEDGRFALLVKTHHCMVDPASGADLLGVLMSPDRFESFPEGPPHRSRPVPSALELVADELARRIRLPRLAWARWRDFARESQGLGDELIARVHGVAEALGYGARGWPHTPLNARIGPHRRLAQVELELDAAREIGRATGVTLNDVILAISAGAIRNLLLEHWLNPATLDFRVSTPLGVGSDSSPEQRRIAEWIVDLPVWEKDALRRLRLIAQSSREVAGSRRALGAQTLFSVARWTSSKALALSARSLSSYARVNATLANVPGPQTPQYLLGARLLQSWGLSPLRPFQGVGITVLSYQGVLYWSLLADFDLVPDVERLAAGIRSAYAELAQAAEDRPSHLRVVS